MHGAIIGILFALMGIAIGVWCMLCFRVGVWLAGGCTTRQHRFAAEASGGRQPPEWNQRAHGVPHGTDVPRSPNRPRGRKDKPSTGVGMLLVLLLLFLAFAGFRTRSQWRGMHRVHVGNADQQKVESRKPTFTAVKFGKTSEDAEQLALEDAYRQTRAYVDHELPNPKWSPSMDYFLRHMVKSKDQEETLLPDNKLGDDRERRIEDGKVKIVAQQVSVKAELSPEVHKDLLRRGRMLMLLKVLAGVIVLLIAVAGYVGIDEVTKGYYTGWLRVAAVAGLGAAALLLA